MEAKPTATARLPEVSQSSLGSRNAPATRTAGQAKGMNVTISIYFLIDPRKPEAVRYVGQTRTPQSRLIQHCCERGRSAKCEWLEEMIVEGVLPQMVILETCSAEDADARERLWIKRFQLSGFEGALTNSGKRHKPAHDPTRELTFKAPPAASTIKTINQVEADLVRETLEDTKWNKLEAAKRLGIGRQTLYNKIKAYGIVEPGQPKAR